MADHELTDPGCSHSDTTNQISRRDVIKSVIATGAVSSTSYLFRVSKVWAQASAPGAVERLITLNVNGQQRRVDVMKQETLVMTLRYKLGLTGTKIGCDRAECGACTVLIDDVPHYSCSVFTHTVRDKKIVTIEGLAKADGTLHPVQQGVIDEQGFQCAFCMSGFVMATVGFLKTNPNPTRARTRSRYFRQPVPVPGLRQDSHRHDARRRESEEGVNMPNVTPPNKYKYIGKNYTTADLFAKVTGKAKYAEDYRADGMLFCKLLLSPMPHARVRNIDASAALAMPGVKAILTVNDLPAPADSITDNGTVIMANHQGISALTNEPLFQGEPILAVAAVDELTAAEAIEKIKIDFEPLPFVVDPLVSLRPGGPNARTDGNVWVRVPPASSEAGGTARGDAARAARPQVDQGRFRSGHGWPFADGQGN